MMRNAFVIAVVLVVCFGGLWLLKRRVHVQVDSSHQWQIDSLTSAVNDANARSAAYLAYADSCARVADSLRSIRIYRTEEVIQEAAHNLGNPDVDSFRVILLQPSR